MGADAGEWRGRGQVGDDIVEGAGGRRGRRRGLSASSREGWHEPDKCRCGSSQEHCCRVEEYEPQRCSDEVGGYAGGEGNFGGAEGDGGGGVEDGGSEVEQGGTQEEEIDDGDCGDEDEGSGCGLKVGGSEDVFPESAQEVASGSSSKLSCVCGFGQEHGPLAPPEWGEREEECDVPTDSHGPGPRCSGGDPECACCQWHRGSGGQCG